MAMSARTWEGMTIVDKIHRAGGRAIVGIGMVAVVETKRVTHVVSGTLRRSVHAAPPGEYHDDDEHDAMSSEDGGRGIDLSLEPVHAETTPMGSLIEVGSWLPYACAEWVGRMHPGITQGLEAARGFRADAIVKQAFREEGLL